jgi:hypothetical protein
MPLSVNHLKSLACVHNKMKPNQNTTSCEFHIVCSCCMSIYGVSFLILCLYSTVKGLTSDMREPKHNVNPFHTKCDMSLAVLVWIYLVLSKVTDKNTFHHLSTFRANHLYLLNIHYHRGILAQKGFLK